MIILNKGSQKCDLEKGTFNTGEFMKNVILALCLALVSTSAFATDVNVTVGASTDYLNHGRSVTNGQPTIFGGLRVENLLLDGVYASVDGVVTDIAPLNERKTVRTELGLGYAFTIKDTTIDLGIKRTFNPVLAPVDYNQFIAKARWSATDKLSVFGEVSKVMSSDLQQDFYANAGVEYRGLFTDKLSVGGLMAVVHGKNDNGLVYNNTELFASYNLGNGFEAFGKYSIGGSSFGSLTAFNSGDIPSGGLLGVRYTF